MKEFWLLCTYPWRIVLVGHTEKSYFEFCKLTPFVYWLTQLSLHVQKENAYDAFMKLEPCVYFTSKYSIFIIVKFNYKTLICYLFRYSSKTIYWAAKRCMHVPCCEWGQNYENDMPGPCAQSQLNINLYINNKYKVANTW